jgi:hypothetical protein
MRQVGETTNAWFGGERGSKRWLVTSLIPGILILSTAYKACSRTRI